MHLLFNQASLLQNIRLSNNFFQPGALAFKFSMHISIMGNIMTKIVEKKDFQKLLFDSKLHESSILANSCYCWFQHLQLTTSRAHFHRAWASISIQYCQRRVQHLSVGGNLWTTKRRQFDWLRLCSAKWPSSWTTLDWTFKLKVQLCQNLIADSKSNRIKVRAW